MFDLISIGNISIDLFFLGDSLTFKENRFQLAVGGKYFSTYFHESVGGGGANVAIGAGLNGLHAAVLGKIGNNPFKKIITDRFKKENVSYDMSEVEENYYNISAVLLTPKGERTIVHYTSPHQHILEGKKTLVNLRKSSTVYFGNLPDVSIGERERIMRFLKKNNILTVVNLGISDCRRSKEQLEGFLKYVDILIINGHEFSELVKAPYKDIHFSDNVIDWYIPHLSTKLVIITEGAKGSFGYFNGKVLHQIAVKVEKIVDTTGTGDGYTAAFIAEYHKSKNLSKAMDRGAKYAARILYKVGAN